MRISFQTFVASTTCLFLVACGMQPYRLPDNQPTAQLNLAVNKSAWICSDGKPHSLEPDQAGHVTIPAGQRIVIGASFYAQGYNVQYSCAPRVSFIPKSGEAYYQDFQIEAEKCYALIYRETKNNPAGVDFEPTMRGGGSCTTVFWPEAPIVELPKVVTPKTTFPAPSVTTTTLPVVKAPKPSSPMPVAPVPPADTAPATQIPSAVVMPEPVAASPEISPKQPVACGDDIATITGSLTSSSARKLLKVDCQLYLAPNNTAKSGAFLSAGNAVGLVRNIQSADGVWWYVEATGAAGWILVRH